MDEQSSGGGPQSEKQGGREYGQFLTLGMQLAVAVVVFFFLGRWLDDRFDTSPWLTLSGAAIGITGGMIKFIKSAQELGKKVDEEIKNSHHGERHEV